MSNPFLIEQAGMYLAYHRDHRNILTHLLGVPMITFSILILASGVSLGNATLAWLLVAGFALLFIRMQPLAGAPLSLAHPGNCPCRPFGKRRRDALLGEHRRLLRYRAGLPIARPCGLRTSAAGADR